MPVAELDAAIPFYETGLGFSVASRSEAPHKAAILTRDHVRIGLSGNGGDPTQDGCAFHVEHLAALFEEFKIRGWQPELSEFDVEDHDGTA
ncbi:MAG: VOC family protein [Vicinamibacterales bacterium]